MTKIPDKKVRDALRFIKPLLVYLHRFSSPLHLKILNAGERFEWIDTDKDLTRFPRFGAVLSTYHQILFRSLSLRVFGPALSTKWISILSGSTSLCTTVVPACNCSNRSSWYPNLTGSAASDELINHSSLAILILWHLREIKMYSFSSSYKKKVSLFFKLLILVLYFVMSYYVRFTLLRYKFILV